MAEMFIALGLFFLGVAIRDAGVRIAAAIRGTEP